MAAAAAAQKPRFDAAAAARVRARQQQAKCRQLAALEAAAAEIVRQQERKQRLVQQVHIPRCVLGEGLWMLKFVVLLSQPCKQAISTGSTRTMVMSPIHSRVVYVHNCASELWLVPQFAVSSSGAAAAGHARRNTASGADSSGHYQDGGTASHPGIPAGQRLHSPPVSRQNYRLTSITQIDVSPYLPYMVALNQTPPLTSPAHMHLRTHMSGALLLCYLAAM